MHSRAVRNASRRGAFEGALDRATSITSPPLCPELRLHLTDDMPGLWTELEQRSGLCGLSAPLWAIAWPGGLALARYILDNAGAFQGARVLDVGSGSGLCAIAAARVGAGRVEAADTDAFAAMAIEANARRNGVQLEVLHDDVVGQVSRWDVVLAADLWYEKFLAHRVTGWLRGLARQGTRVLVGDSRRAYSVRAGMEPLARYTIDVSHALEPAGMATAEVWRLEPLAPGRRAC